MLMTKTVISRSLALRVVSRLGRWISSSTIFIILGLMIQVAGYALLAEMAEIDLNVINQLTAQPLWKVCHSDISGTFANDHRQVLINRIVLRLHLCADTLTAVTTFCGDLSTLFESPDTMWASILCWHWPHGSEIWYRTNKAKTFKQRTCCRQSNPQWWYLTHVYVS